MANQIKATALEEDAFALTQAALGISRAREENDEAALSAALDANLQLWVGIRTMLAHGTSPLPASVQENLIRLSHFVAQKTLELRAGLKPETLETLVNTNLQIAEGLLEGTTKSG